MPSEKDIILEFNQYMKSDKMPCIVYADIDSLIRKIYQCANNPENFSTKKMWEHICGYSMSIICGFYHIENKDTLYHEKDCMKKLCVSSREQAKNIIDFANKQMFSLTKEELKSHQDAKACYICRKKS